MAAPNKLGPLNQRALTNRNQGAVPAPSPTIAGAELTTEIYTYFAKPPVDGQLPTLYNGDRQYAQVTLTLETAGPVAVGQRQNILPVLSGKGALLETGVPLTFTIAKGTRIYVAATAINRIKVSVQPIPWLEQITGILSGIAKGA